jgi:acyl-CoA synthetase (AMP-forming)/AMP-acid ligase II
MMKERFREVSGRNVRLLEEKFNEKAFLDGWFRTGDLGFKFIR